jgi:hypothetical protein
VTRDEAIAVAAADNEALVVHRDLGHGFAHHVSHDCPCGPTVVVRHGRTAQQIIDDLDRAERESTA